MGVQYSDLAHAIAVPMRQHMLSGSSSLTTSSIAINRTRKMDERDMFGQRRLGHDATNIDAPTALMPAMPKREF